MRTLVPLIIFCLTVWVSGVTANPTLASGLGSTSQSKSKLDLFVLKRVPTESDMVLPVQERFNKLLSEAMQIELVRLSGSRRILSNKDARSFLRQPRVWLKSYRTEPYQVDGVIVGEQWIFEFDRARLYQAFQQAGLLIWPEEKRPTTLVFGSRRLDSQVTYLTQKVLQQQSFFDFSSQANDVGLPIIIPKQHQAWPNLNSTASSPVIAAHLASEGAHWALVYEFVYDVSGKQGINWRLFNRKGRTFLSGEEFNDTNELQFSREQLKSLFETLLSFYARPYRDQASILGAVNLELNGVTSFEQIQRMEAHLNQAKPKIHRVFLSRLNTNQAVFEIDYQGDLASVIELLRQVEGLQIDSSELHIGQIEASFPMKKPPEALIKEEKRFDSDTFAVSDSGSESIEAVKVVPLPPTEPLPALIDLTQPSHSSASVER